MEDDASRRFHPFGPRDGAIVGKRLRIRFAETAEVTILHHNLCRLVHQLNIRSVAQQPGKTKLERILLKMDVIFIGTLRGIKAGMSIVAYRDDPFYGDIIRQQGIETPEEDGGRRTEVGGRSCHF